MSVDPQVARERVDSFRERFGRLEAEIGKEVIGYSDVIQEVLICLFAGGHVLLEGVPGLGKTLLVRTLAKALDVPFSRIQFSPDLMPADIVGTNILVDTEGGGKSFQFQKGPVFANVILADEVNRATPKTQSAMLEAMQEHSVTVGGHTYRLDEPFFVLGTQNPIDMEGTYPLPEAQVDRFFFKLMVGYLEEEDLLKVIDLTTSKNTGNAGAVLRSEEILEMRELVREVVVADHVKRYAVRLAQATQPKSKWATEDVQRYVKFGSSPRGIQAMMLGAKVKALIDGRFHVSCDDLRAVMVPALRHRMILNFEGEAEDKSTDDILASVLSAIDEVSPAASA